MSASEEKPPTPAEGGRSPEAMDHDLRTLVSGHVAETAIRCAVPTRSRVDTGNWVAGGRVWAVVPRSGGLILAAAGRRPWLERVEAEAVAESIYNHVTGELVLAPGTGLTMRSLKMGPVEGRTLQAMLQEQLQDRQEHEYA